MQQLGISKYDENSRDFVDAGSKRLEKCGALLVEYALKNSRFKLGEYNQQLIPCQEHSALKQKLSNKVEINQIICGQIIDVEG